MNHLFRLLAVIALTFTGGAPDSANAEPTIDDRQVHDLLRTTIIVSDYDRAHALFHGILGMPVDLSMDLEGETVNELMGQTGRSMRITIFNVNGTSSGRIAVLAYLDDQSEEVPAPEKLDPGAVVVVFETTNIDEIARRVAEAGYRIISGPSVLFHREDHVLQAKEMIFVGPDGIAVNLIQRGVAAELVK
jgi:catechol 2,3-dioxygenase-like lactoylglutathione lyase family enzyme